MTTDDPIRCRYEDCPEGHPAVPDFLGNLRREGDTILAVVKPHTFVPPKRRRDATGRPVADPFCATCGYHRDTNMPATFHSFALYVHPEQDPRS